MAVNPYSAMSQTAQANFQTRLLRLWNKECAHRQNSILLPVPQPHRYGHFALVEYHWTSVQSITYLTTGQLPCSLRTINQESRMISMWFFSTEIMPGMRVLPELDVEIEPDFGGCPAYVVLDMGKDRFRVQQVALIPSECLDRVLSGNDLDRESGKRAVQYSLRHGLRIDMFTGKADLKSLEELEERILKGLK